MLIRHQAAYYVNTVSDKIVEIKENHGKKIAVVAAVAGVVASTAVMIERFTRNSDGSHNLGL